MPAAAGLDDLALLGEAGHHAVEVVLLDPHRLGELGDGDARAGAHQLERLQRRGCREPLGRPRRAGAGAPTRSRARAARGAAARRRAAAGVPPLTPAERALGRLEPLVLLHERLELLQPRLDLLALLLEEVRHPNLTFHKNPWSVREVTVMFTLP